MLSLGQPHRIIFFFQIFQKCLHRTFPLDLKELIGLTASTNRLLSSKMTCQDEAAFRSLCIMTMTSNSQNLLLNSENTSPLPAVERAQMFLHRALFPSSSIYHQTAFDYLQSGHYSVMQLPITTVSLCPPARACFGRTSSHWNNLLRKVVNSPAWDT